tara:strand:- start:1973 stop:2221 length:249 start_codon:yes stop_codon:yes gene_type:complete
MGSKPDKPLTVATTKRPSEPLEALLIAPSSRWSLAATYRTSQVASFWGLVLAGSAKNSHRNMFNLLSIESDPIGFAIGFLLN